MNTLNDALNVILSIPIKQDPATGGVAPRAQACTPPSTEHIP